MQTYFGDNKTRNANHVQVSQIKLDITIGLIPIGKSPHCEFHLQLGTSVIQEIWYNNHRALEHLMSIQRERGNVNKLDHSNFHSYFQVTK